MRLIIQLDEKINESILYEEDIVLTNNYDYYVKNKIKREVVFINYSLDDDNPELSEKINELFGGFPKDYLRFRNICYSRMFRPIYSILTQIEQILHQRNISTIVLIGGSEHIFLTLNLAEGEGKKWCYKSSWFMNPIIKQYFSVNKKVTILWTNKKSKVKISAINYVRENLLLYKGLLSKLARFIKTVRNRTAKYDYIREQKNIVLSIVKFPLQYKHMSYLLGKISNIYPIYVMPDNLHIYDTENVIRIKSMSIINIIKVFIDSHRRRNDKDIVYFNIKGTKIRLSKESIERCLKLLKFQMDCKKIELTETINNLKLSEKFTIATDMTFGIDIIVSNEIAKEKGVKHVNFQYVAMKKMLYPQIELADEYYLYAKKTFNLYKEYSNTYKYYLPIIKKPEELIYNKNNIKISIFTQPDMYTDKYLYFIKLLMEKLKSENIEINIIIKPHYRQNKLNEFIKLADNVSFIQVANKEDDVGNLIESSDISISMTSSVLFEALMLGKMGIIVDLDDTNRSIIYENDICFPEVNFVVNSIENLINIIKKYPEYMKMYINRYEKFIFENGGVIDYEKIFKI